MGMFQNAGGRGQAKPGESRLSLAAFGKHPGWDDHIVGIGVETEVLAHVKQSLYVGGIGRQIDLGSWEKLEPEKKVEGFDHTFLWFRNGHVLLGRFWSSKDRKGRAKYPMVLCLDSEGLSPGYLMAKAAPELEGLRASCKAIVSANQVTTECTASQERLRGMLERETPTGMFVGSDQKQRFLECPALGPDREGLLRVVHELDNALGVSSGNRINSPAALANLRPYHIRVPRCFDYPNEGILVWADFLRSVLPHTVPLMLIARNEVDWIEVIIGEPSSDDYFCLQASPQALPLATQVPYELGPDLRARFKEMELRFLTPEGSAESSGTIFIKKAGDPAGVDGTAAAPKRVKKGWLWLLIGLLVVGAAAAGVYYSMLNGDTAYQTHLQAAQTALVAKNFEAARAEVEAALKAKPNAPEAVKLKDELVKHQREIAEQAARERTYQQALKAAQTAFDQKDYENAISQADEALKIKVNDSAAVTVRSNAQSQLLVVKAQAENDLKYKQATEAANAAMIRKDYTAAVTQADAALALRPDDAAAMKIKSDAQARQREFAAQVEREQQYKLAMGSAQIALDRDDYARAVTQANAALTLRPNDSAAIKLKSEAQARQREAALKAETEKKYNDALSAARAAFDKQDFAAAIAQATAALAIKPNDSSATQLLSKVKDKKAAQEQAEQAAKTAQEAQAAAPPAPHSNPATTQTPPVVLASTSTAAPETASPAVSAPTVDGYDMELRNLMIQLHVKAAGPNVLTNGGTARPLPRGFLPADSIDQFNKEVDRLRKIYQNNKWLDAERKKDLDKLSDALLSWN